MKLEKTSTTMLCRSLSGCASVNKPTQLSTKNHRPATAGGVCGTGAPASPSPQDQQGEGPGYPHKPLIVNTVIKIPALDSGRPGLEGFVGASMFPSVKWG